MLPSHDVIVSAEYVELSVLWVLKSTRMVTLALGSSNTIFSTG